MSNFGIEDRITCMYCGAEKYPNQEDCSPDCQRKERLQDSKRCLQQASDQQLLDELVLRAEARKVP